MSRSRVLAVLVVAGALGAGALAAAQGSPDVTKGKPKAPAITGDKPAIAGRRMPDPSPPSIGYHRYALRNGLQLFVVPDHTTPTVAIVTYYRVGSKDERPGRTGFAHLFEHMMFKGSAHTPDGMLDVLFERAGGTTNAFTTSDQTVYHDIASSSFLETALWLEADRIAGLTDTLDQAKLDNQREVVRNERRQSYENQPYGEAWLRLSAALWPAGHGYHWDTIGSHEDLLAASTDDVKAFFRQYYVPSNAVMVIVGDVDPEHTKALADKYLGWIPAGKTPARPTYATPAPITKQVTLTATDDVQVPRVYLAWRGPTPYAADTPALDLAAQVLASGKNSRLYQALVFEQRIAQDVEAELWNQELGGQFTIVVTAKPGVSPAKLTAAIDAELAKLARTAPTDAEVERVKAQREATFIRGLEDLIERGTKLAFYVVQAGDPNYLFKDLARYAEVTPAQITRAVATWLKPTARVHLTISPPATGAKAVP